MAFRRTCVTYKSCVLHNTRPPYKFVPVSFQNDARTCRPILSRRVPSFGETGKEPQPTLADIGPIPVDFGPKSPNLEVRSMFARFGPGVTSFGRYS